MAAQEIVPNHSLIPGCELVEYEEILALLIERIGQLPLISRRILAMYYYDTFPLPEIAACFGLAEHQIEETHAETVDLLSKYHVSLSTGTLKLGNSGSFDSAPPNPAV
jgi:DNA-directed RNA polymerase specialized sigma subunit